MYREAVVSGVYQQLCIKTVEFSACYLYFATDELLIHLAVCVRFQFLIWITAVQTMQA